MEKLRRFMYGRYGVDQLGFALVIFGCVLTIVLSLFRLFSYRQPLLLLAFRLIGLLPYLFFLLRALSKNIEKRRAENEKFLRAWYPTKDFFTAKLSHLRDKEHRYYKCPGCSKTLRVPKGKGKIEISCPHCGRKFKKRT